MASLYAPYRAHSSQTRVATPASTRAPMATLIQAGNKGQASMHVLRPSSTPPSAQRASHFASPLPEIGLFDSANWACSNPGGPIRFGGIHGRTGHEADGVFAAPPLRSHNICYVSFRHFGRKRAFWRCFRATAGLEGWIRSILCFGRGPGYTFPTGCSSIDEAKILERD